MTSRDAECFVRKDLEVGKARLLAEGPAPQTPPEPAQPAGLAENRKKMMPVLPGTKEARGPYCANPAELRVVRLLVVSGPPGACDLPARPWAPAFPVLWPLLWCAVTAPLSVCPCNLGWRFACGLTSLMHLRRVFMLWLVLAFFFHGWE